MGLIGALIISIPILFINMQGGMHRAAIAAVLQFGYSFIIISFNTGLCRRFAKTRPFVAVLLPTSTTTILTYLLHWFAMSPEPLGSAIYAMITGFGGFIPQTIRFRHSDKPLSDLFKEWKANRKKTI